jgi:hypothetical protein
MSLSNLTRTNAGFDLQLYLDPDQNQYFNQHQDLDTQQKDLILLEKTFKTLAVQTNNHSQARGSLLLATALKPNSPSFWRLTNV